MIKISIIIPFKNAGDTIGECLEHVLNDPCPGKEVILVDDGSDDNSRINVPDIKDIRLIRLNESHGPAYCRNLGAGEAKGDVCVFIDSDILIPEGTIQQFADTFSGNPDIAAVVGMLSERCIYTNLCSCYFNLRKYYDYYSIKENHISSFYSSVGGIRKNVFIRYGGFSTGYSTASVEDAELANRLITGGEKIMLNKNIRVGHKKHHSLASLLKSDYNRAVLFGELLIKRKMIKNTARKKRFFSFRLNSIIASTLSLALLYILPLAFIFPVIIWILILLISSVILLNLRFIILSLNKIRVVQKLLFIFLLILDSAVVGTGAFWGIAKRLFKINPIPDSEMVSSAQK